MPKELAKARILMHLELIDVPQSQSNAETSDEYQRQHICQLIDHFAETSFPWAGSPQCQRVLQTWGLTLAVTNPFLMHGILAFSGSHLHTLEPQNTKYRTAASLHYGLSLTGFAASLGDTVTSDNADALFACCYLHAMLAFHYKRRPDGSYAITEAGPLFPWPAVDSDPEQEQLPLAGRDTLVRPLTAVVAAERRAILGGRGSGPADRRLQP